MINRVINFRLKQSTVGKDIELAWIKKYKYQLEAFSQFVQAVAEAYGLNYHCRKTKLFYLIKG